MGAVTVDIYKNEREYKHLTLSDKAVVKYLLLFRSKIDIGHGASINININQAGDIYEFNQELICLYASLDTLLDKITLKEKESKFLELIFEGNKISDLIEHYGFPRKTAYRVLNRIVDKVVNQDMNEWKVVMKKQEYIKK